MEVSELQAKLKQLLGDGVLQMSRREIMAGLIQLRRKHPRGPELQQLEKIIELLNR